jgi:hypothetical protein
LKQTLPNLGKKEFGADSLIYQLEFEKDSQNLPAAADR